ncbi:hypothetical protein [Rhodanobacter aciditrophus]|uniref:hypothetical protein n=1 Tax=Rhodanobacter aciditrophus TaxID=1623218 RepID=UPI003CF2DE0C
MRYVLLAMAILLAPAIPTQAQAQTQLSIGISDRGVSLGFVMSTYPALVRIPGYPVYYDPRVDANYFFYDGLYWVYQDDNWYSSSWYNGPWDMIPPAYVPWFILRVPVRYYRRPPAYFRYWRADAAPRWGERWGRDWERQHSGWDRWDRRSVPVAAPLPSYQRNYTGNRYPRQREQQRAIQSRSYHYQPREAVSRQILEQRRQGAPAREQEQQQQRNAMQQQNLQQQRQRSARPQQNLQLQQQRTVRSQQNLQQQRNARPPQNVQQQRQQRIQQQRAQPAQRARGAERKGEQGQADKGKKQRGNNQDNGGHP